MAKAVLGCLLTTGVLFSLALYIAARPAVNRNLLSKIKPGTTRQLVSNILGNPNYKYGETDWRYWRWGNSGWVEIAFDDNGVVINVNDESAFR